VPFEAMVTISDGGAEGEIEMTSEAQERHAKLQNCCQRGPGALSEV
jgi:hypothetical protein